MKRRSFLQRGLAGAALATSAVLRTQTSAAQTTSEDTMPTPQPTNAAVASEAASIPREYYLLRRYRLARAQTAGCDHYLAGALLPALGRLGFPSTGAFSLEYGPETPATYLLLRHHDLPTLLHLDEALDRDDTFVKAAAPFRAAPAANPSFERIDSILLQAFAGRPVLQAPAPGKRILQLRTYESPSHAAHIRKIEMFHSGEFDIFSQCGMHQVFYAQTLAGDRMPSLTYMLSHDSLADMEAKWARFGSNPDWKRLSTDPRFSYEDLVSNITNLVLSPKSFSQI